MNKVKLLDELTKNELEKVFERNTKLQSEVMDFMAESEMHWIGEQLDYLRDTLVSWSIGQCNRNQHITVGDPWRFVCALAKLQEDIPVLGQEYDERIEAVLETDDEEKIESEAQALADALVSEYTRILDDVCLDLKHAKNYFLEFYVDAYMRDEGYYIDAEYTLYKPINYVESYA